MERQKSILGRKKKGPVAAPGDFIALGKQSKSGETELKRPLSPTHLGRKKDSPSGSISSGSLAKKPKLGGSVGTSLSRSGEGSSGSSSLEDFAVSVEPTEFLASILAADDEMNDERTESLICGIVKHLRNNRAKPDPVIYLSVMHLSKSKPVLFCSDVIVEAFCGLLKRDMALSFKAKGNSLVSVLACNILMTAFADEQNWPDNFIKVFVEDSLGERVWVDREDCRNFTDNLITAFGTKKSPKHLLCATIDPSRPDTPGSSSPSQIGFDDEEPAKTTEKGDGDSLTTSTSSIAPRYPCQLVAIETYVLDTIRDVLNRRQAMDSSSRNLIRLMTSTSGIGEVRNMAAQRMDMWLQNPKLTRVSQDLLLAVCTNCDKHDKIDLEVMWHLTKMRLKTKPLINHLLLCMRELLSQHPDNLRMVLHHTVYNELSTSRNPNNMSLLGVVFSHSPDAASKILAEIFQDLLTNKEDYLRALRILLREIVRVTRLDMNFSAFCLSLMQERTESKFAEMDSTLKERYIISIADLVSMNVLLSVSPNIREAATALMQGDKKNLELIQVFKKQVSIIQRDSVWWLHTVVPKVIELKAEVYLHCLKKVLFLESTDQYCNKDNWPPESERGLMLRLVSEALVLEDTLMRILVIGLWRDLPLSAPDAVELVDQLVCRATNLYDLGLRDVLQMERLEFFDALLNLCVYKHPESIVLPTGYAPPNLAITGLMWKAWLVLLIITAYNPSVFGERAWQTYPTLQFFMEMVMTNNFKFPPSTTASSEKKAEEYRAQERQIRQQEIQMIMEFETHLAAASRNVTITESTSLLIGQLNHNNPVGPARFPPQEIIDQLKSLNNSLKLGQMLCRSRNPDFLMRIINRQGTSQSMPWLAELVESSEGSLDVLPVQCLCEFLLHDPTDISQEVENEEFYDKSKSKQKNRKHEQLLSRLQDLVHGTSQDSKTVKEVLDYFLQRLSSTQSLTREQAIKGLSLVVGPLVSCDEENSPAADSKPSHKSDEWLSQHIPSLPLFHEVKDSISLALRKACQVDTDAPRINSYILYLASHNEDASQQILSETSLDLAQLLVERTSVMNLILPQVATKPIQKTARQQETLMAFIRIFLKYMQGARKEQKDTFSWSNAQDQILVEWESGQSATVHVLVVQAMIILLTYGRPEEDPDHEDNKEYTDLLDMWIQNDCRMPSAFLMDTSEEALLLPDWLKLRMLRSQDKKLVNAALLEVEPSQLVLFVQSFGIPTSSMSRLLSALDEAVTADPQSVSQALKDKSYLINLIDIQHQSGAVGGKTFYAMLVEDEDEDKDKPTIQKALDAEKIDEEMSTQNMWSVESSGDVILPNSVDKISRLIDQIFSDIKGTEKGPAKLFQCFLQAISTDKGKAATVIRALDNLLSSSKKEAFATKVFSATFRSCPILRILIAKQPELHSELFSVVEKLQVLGQGKKSMLTSIITQFLTTHSTSAGRHAKKTDVTDALLDKIARVKKLDTKSLKKDLREITDTHKLEVAFHKMMEVFVTKKHSEKGTKIACEMLAEDGLSDMTSSCAKLLIDWLSLLDPEITKVNPEMQQRLLFAHSRVGEDGGGGRRQVASQAHLLALLTHQASWHTLKDCLNNLLQAKRVPELDPTATLDFIWACAHIPKIWHGREKKAQEMDTAEDILGLTGPQLHCVVDLIAEEAAMTGPTEAAGTSSEKRPLILNSRINLLLLSICEDMEKVNACVQQLEESHSNYSGFKKDIVANLAIQLYLHFPYIQSFLPESSTLLDQLFRSSHLLSQIDVISHRLITSLSQTKPGPKSENQMYDANIACRKLAAHHPTIFLRQLPLISAILSGQTQFTIGEMKHTHRLQLFTHVLGLMELLQPHLFETEHQGLLGILESFFSLMQTHGKEQKALGSLVFKFVMVLQNFLTHNPEQAFPFLSKYMELLVRLGHDYPDMLDLKALVTNLMLPRQSEATGKYQQAKRKVDDCKELISVSGGYTASQLAPFIRRLSKNSSDDILQALQDLDEMSKRKVEILAYFQAQLEKLMVCCHDQCRGTTFTLVMRSLRHNPRKAESFVSAFLDCLENENPDVVTSALKNLPEFTALCQEEAPTILQKAFTVGIKLSLDTSSCISEALQMINLHSTAVQ